MDTELWCIPLNLTEDSLHTGSILARRIPHVLARMLRESGAVRADWAPLMVEVEEGLGYVVTVATADDTETHQHLAELSGDYLLFGQLDLTEERIWLDARLFSRRRDETLIYLHFSGTREEFLEWMPEWAREVAEAVHGPLPPEIAKSLSGPVTRVWDALRFYCNGLDAYGADIRDPEWERRVLIQLLAALENDPGLEWAAELAAEVIRGCLRAGEWEHAADLEQYLWERAPDSPTAQALHQELAARFQA